MLYADLDSTCHSRLWLGRSALFGRGVRCRLCFGPSWRNVMRRGVAFHDGNMFDLHGVEGPVVAVARHAGNFLHQLHGSRVALPEDGVVAVEHGGLLPSERLLGDEKLRAIGIRTGVGIR